MEATGDVETGDVEKAEAIWYAAVDPTSGVTYYFNRGTNETTWTVPDQVDPSEIVIIGDAVVEDEESIEPYAAVENVETEIAATISNNASEFDDESEDDGWRYTIDPTTELVYFYNKFTKETSWESPYVKQVSSTTFLSPLARPLTILTIKMKLRRIVTRPKMQAK